MEAFKRGLMMGVVAIFVAGCQGYTKVAPAPPPTGHIDHSAAQSNTNLQHTPSACPLWNGEYVTSTGIKKRIETKYDNKGNLILNDFTTGSSWIVNGKPEWITEGTKKNPQQASYSAFCNTNLKLNNNSVSQAAGIQIEVYQDNKEIFVVTYVTNTNTDPSGNAFDFSISGLSNAPFESPETFHAIGFQPQTPTPTPTPTPSGTPAP